MESFVVKWNAFQENVSSSFSNLRKEEDFFDVTLVTEDEQLLNAHKVVLSAASDFFKTVLRRANHVKPLIYLHGVGSSQLVHIMDYIYEGETKIQQKDLDKFLEVAQKLKIAGLLCENNEQQQELDVEEPEQEQRNAPAENTVIARDIVQREEVKPSSKENEHSLYDHISDSEDNSLQNYNLTTNDKENQRPMTWTEIKEAVNKIVWKINSNHWMCSVCKQSFKESNALRKHAQIHIDGISLTCYECGKKFTTSTKLNVHRYKKHGNGSKIAKKSKEEREALLKICQSLC